MEPAGAATTRQRRQDLDLIRTAVVGGLVFYHTALIFGPVDFYVNNRPPNLGMTSITFFLALFGMPLLFVIAGAGAWHSLRARTAGGFVRERLSRLLVPLVVGVVLLVPPQIYFSLRADGQHPEWWPFLGRFFAVRLGWHFPSIIQPGRSDGHFDVAHLWFLYYLLIFSLLLLPVFLYLRRGVGQRLLEWMLACCRSTWGVLLFAVPVAVIEAALGTWGPGGWNSSAYLLFLLYGFLMAADPRIGQAIQDRWAQCALIGTVVLLALFVIAHYDLGGADQVVGRDYDPWSVLWRLLKAVGGWTWTVAMFGLAPFLLRHRPKRVPSPAAAGNGAPKVPGRSGVPLADRVARYAKEAVLPFYILHQTPIVVVGFYVVQWEVGVLAKFLTISLASLVVTLLVYDLCVRRTNATRAIFGMSPIKPRPHPAAPPVTGDRLGERRYVN